MDKVGLKLSKVIDYDLFEPLQYWLDYEVEYEDILGYIQSDEVIELELEEDENRVEDLEMLGIFLEKFTQSEICYEVFVMNKEWEKTEFVSIA
ncbi:MAG: Unknown protein [uncultured Sulfurovum sp.]|uniref:Uncharacterized protein n=1 Tax=uncultured Sulfurovum sp. TaxID=269237 RepID=A0A6S6U9A4_9BACT|nr:MAG: Unknown protein [uncultured Sulfurovum sp.]